MIELLFVLVSKWPYRIIEHANICSCTTDAPLILRSPPRCLCEQKRLISDVFQLATNWMNTMKEKVTGRHGLAGVNILVDLACKQQKMGTCDGENLHAGTVGQTFGRQVYQTPINEQPSEDKLNELAASMLEDEGATTEGVADAGMALPGQFIDHDLTLDATTELGEAAGDVRLIRNFRTPRLDLGSIYGEGPEVSPYLYYPNNQRRIFGRRKGDVDDQNDNNSLDLQRDRNGTALIADPRIVY